MNDSPRKRNARSDTARRNAALQKKMRQQKIQRQKALLIGIGLLLLFLLSMSTSACITRNRKAKEAAAQAEQKKAKEKEAKKETKKAFDPVSLTVSVVGDCTLGTDEAFDYSTSLNAYFDNYGSSYFLQNVKPIFSADDLTIANFEGTLTESDAREDKTFAFKAPASFAKILTDGNVEAVTTANNHSHDYGEQGFTDTLNALEAEEITHFGYDETAVMNIKGIKVGLVGIYELKDHLERTQQVKDNIAKVKAEGAQLVIVIFHWGNEKEEVPDSNQMTLGRLAIDEGADLVCGHHPHVLQGIETYKGKNIVYSLGNFCFGGNSAPSDMDSMIFQQTFTITENGVQADNVTNIIPCSISSEYGYNNYQPTPAEGEEAQRIQNKIEERSAMIPVKES
ncbi:MAG: CapA family protein [Clostridiales bacterium]|nr:CapA family protein [Clostridiales bacterium]